VPTPVGPAPRDPNDPDFWDWGDTDTFSPNGGHDDTDLLADLARRRTRRRLIALVVVALMVAAILVTSL
jgi:hypothetical protein